MAVSREPRPTGLRDRVLVPKRHGPNGSSNTNPLSYNSESRKSEIKALAGLVSSEAVRKAAPYVSGGFCPSLAFLVLWQDDSSRG